MLESELCSCLSEMIVQLTGAGRWVWPGREWRKCLCAPAISFPELAMLHHDPVCPVLQPSQNTVSHTDPSVYGRFLTLLLDYSQEKWRPSEVMSSSSNDCGSAS